MVWKQIKINIKLRKQMTNSHFQKVSLLKVLIKPRTQRAKNPKSHIDAGKTQDLAHRESVRMHIRLNDQP